MNNKVGKTSFEKLLEKHGAALAMFWNAMANRELSEDELVTRAADLLWQVERESGLENQRAWLISNAAGTHSATRELASVQEEDEMRRDWERPRLFIPGILYHAAMRATGIAEPEPQDPRVEAIAEEFRSRYAENLSESPSRQARSALDVDITRVEEAARSALSAPDGIGPYGGLWSKIVRRRENILILER